jgi:general secretion pathway protein N
MPVESAGARTWLLAAVALWALATWLLGLAGLGGRIERLPPDPGLVQDLPSVAQPGDARPGPLAQYTESRDRPLFAPDRRPQSFVLDPQAEDAPADFEYVLTSVLISPGLEVAIVRPAQGGEPVRLKVGEAAEGAPGWQLASLEPRRAVFEGPDGRRALELRVFDGVGGEPPTPISVAPRPSQPQPASTRAPTPTQGSTPTQAPTPGSRSSSPTSTPTPVTAPPGNGARRPAAEPVRGEGANGVPESQPTPQPPTPAPQTGPPADASGTPSPEAQVEAIRRRIEERRARMRELGRQGQPPGGSP